MARACRSPREAATPLAEWGLRSRPGQRGNKWMWPARPRKQKRPRLWAGWDQGLAQSTQPRLFSGSLRWAWKEANYQATARRFLLGSPAWLA